MPGVIDAYFDDDIEILVAAPGDLNSEQVRKILSDFEIEVTKIEREG